MLFNTWSRIGRGYINIVAGGLGGRGR